LTSVNRPIHINRVLRECGWLQIRRGPFGESLLPGESAAFAVADHQLAHVYVRDADQIEAVRTRLQSVPGIGSVVDPSELKLNHPRSGELIALAEPDAWFTYYYWLDDAAAPDFARTVDIHRKPGYDPCELFATSTWRGMRKLIRKRLGFRYSMDIVPLDATLVRGSHGLHPQHASDGPLIVGPGELPDDMRGFAEYARRTIGGS
jgi:predicted AlkP superfamily pyrophosphatase or phosphodiesterase